jgi:hypothetical protein
VSAPLTLAQALERAYATHDAQEALGERTRANYAAKVAAWEQHRKACRAVSEALALERGWRVSPGQFTLRQLLTGASGAAREDDLSGLGRGSAIDHAEFYRAPARPYRPVAIVSHTYLLLAEVFEFVTQHGLACEVLPVRSWYFPGACLPVLFSAPKVTP